MENEYDIVTEDEMDEIMQSFMDSSSEDADLPYKDKFVTEEQKQRDIEVTKLLQAYVKTYEKKVEVSEKYQKLILYPCMAIICIFAIVLLIFSYYIVSKKSELKINDLAAFITACISFISLIIGLLTIITKYFFPENGEQYITQIVETIQKNDLENKRENAKNIKTENDENS